MDQVLLIEGTDYIDTRFWTLNSYDPMLGMIGNPCYAAL